MDPRKKENWTPGDPAHKKMIAYGIVAVFIGILLVLGMRSVSGPQLYAGDRLEVMACRQCQGSGQVGADRCPLCLGTKKLKVIIPGPAHPVELRGTVRDASAFPTPEDAQAVAAKEATEVTLKPVQGAVRNARLTFGSIHIEGKVTGRFRCDLPPGTYQVSIQAEGYPEHHEELVIPARKLPVWPKRPGLESTDEETLRPVFLLKH